MSLAYTNVDGKHDRWSWLDCAGIGCVRIMETKNLVLGAYLFGIASIMHLVLQGFGGMKIPSLLAMLPYLATLVVMIFIGSNRMKRKTVCPHVAGPNV